jgi:putative transposase
MARKLRVEYEGAIYHVLDPGDRREPIFKSDADRQLFLTTLDQCCKRTGWEVHAYVLMPNHFHLVVETPQANLVDGMKWFLGTYTNRFNRRHKLFGHLFSGRYKAIIVDGSSDGYLKTLCDYVHLNPSRANLIGPRTPLTRFQWSSWPEYLKAPSKRPFWLRVDRLMGEHGIPKDSVAGRRELERRVEARRAGEDEEEYRNLRRGWCLGDADFRKELLDQMAGELGAQHYGEERRETAAERAEHIVRSELRKAGWKEINIQPMLSLRVARSNKWWDLYWSKARN